MPNPNQSLYEVVDSGRAILDWCVGRTFGDYTADRQFRRAVDREFGIIGEALARVSRQDPEVAAQIGELSRIVGFRNRIIHGYDVIDHAAVWGVIQGRLPKLIDEVSALLEKSG